MPLDPQAPEFYCRLHRRLQSSRPDLLAYLLSLNLREAGLMIRLMVSTTTDMEIPLIYLL